MHGKITHAHRLRTTPTPYKIKSSCRRKDSTLQRHVFSVMSSVSLCSCNTATVTCKGAVFLLVLQPLITDTSKVLSRQVLNKSIDQMLVFYIQSSDFFVRLNRQKPPLLHGASHILHFDHSQRDTAQVSNHEMITIYIAHTIGYKADPIFSGCCCSCRDDGIPIEHLAPCLWPCCLFYDKVIFQDMDCEGPQQWFMADICMHALQHAACK